MDKPTVWFKLYRNIEGGEPVAVEGAELKELPSGTESVTWEGMPLNDMDGNTYTYSVIEVDEEGVAFEPENQHPKILFLIYRFATHVSPHRKHPLQRFLYRFLVTRSEYICQVLMRDTHIIHIG